MCLREKIGPDPRNFNQRVSLGRNDLLIRTFLSIQVDVSARVAALCPSGSITVFTLSSIPNRNFRLWSARNPSVNSGCSPDGTLFTFYRSSDNPLEGVITLWEMEMEITGPLVARFEHR
jgi:hypothetical protein